MRWKGTLQDKSEIFLRTRGPISKNQSIHLSPSWQQQGPRAAYRVQPGFVWWTNPWLKTGHLRNHPRLTSHPHPCSNKYINWFSRIFVYGIYIYMHYHSVNSLITYFLYQKPLWFSADFGPSSSIHHLCFSFIGFVETQSFWSPCPAHWAHTTASCSSGLRPPSFSYPWWHIRSVA